MPASRAGKAKTFSRSSPWGWRSRRCLRRDPLILSVVVIAVVLTVASGLEYLFTRRHRMETG